MRNELTKKIKLARRFTLIGVVLVTCCGLALLSIFSSRGGQTLTIGTNRLHIETANTVQEKRSGLCCRNSLSPDSGMLFIYDAPAIHKFWMKNTRIPLDMYWIDSGRKIVYIQRNVKPNTYPKTFGPDIPAQYILETNAGYAETHTIQVGDTAQF